MENVKLNEGFTQVCVWPGTELGDDTVEDFVNFFIDVFSTRIQFLEIILTNPNPGETSEESGGRSDVFFAVHQDDIGHFAIPRLAYGIRWIEDVYFNDQGFLYPERVAEYRSWDA